MSSTLKLTLWFTGLVVAIFLGTALFFYYNPVGVGVWLARRALTQADFDKQQVEGPRGTLTYWEGGAGLPIHTRQETPFREAHISSAEPRSDGTRVCYYTRSL